MFIGLIPRARICSEKQRGIKVKVARQRDLRRGRFILHLTNNVSE